MRETCGVQVVDMSIEDITITNEALAQAMSQAAVAVTHLDSARIELEVNRTQAESEQIADVTRAEGRARAAPVLACPSHRAPPRAARVPPAADARALRTAGAAASSPSARRSSG